MLSRALGALLVLLIIADVFVTRDVEIYVALRARWDKLVTALARCL
jgi:hypothetical protein